MSRTRTQVASTKGVGHWLANALTANILLWMVSHLHAAAAAAKRNLHILSFRRTWGFLLVYFPSSGRLCKDERIHCGHFIRLLGMRKEKSSSWAPTWQKFNLFVKSSFLDSSCWVHLKALLFPLVVPFLPNTLHPHPTLKLLQTKRRIFES